MNSRPVNFNTFVSACGTAAVCIVAYFGKHEFESMSAHQEQTTAQVIQMNLAITEIKGKNDRVVDDLMAMRAQVQQMVTHGELRAELSSRDQEILELKKALSQLAARVPPAGRPSQNSNTTKP